MHKTETAEMSADAWDELNDPRPGICEFDEIVDAALTRRGFVQGVLAFGSCASIAGVITTELLNTAIEDLVAVLHPEHDPKIGRVLDVAAGAVLIASIAAVVIGLIVFVGPLWTTLAN